MVTVTVLGGLIFELGFPQYETGTGSRGHERQKTVMVEMNNYHF